MSAKPVFVVNHVGSSYGEGMRHSTVVVGHALSLSALTKGAELYAARPRAPMDYEAVMLALQRVRERQGGGAPVESFAVAFAREVEQYHGVGVPR